MKFYVYTNAFMGMLISALFIWTIFQSLNFAPMVIGLWKISKIISEYSYLLCNFNYINPFSEAPST